jgi:peptidoglycan LD-endopeptidase CwlK
MRFRLSKRSYDRLVGVHPSLVMVVRRAIEITDIDFGVLMGVRTQEQQNALYDQGRTKPGAIVTWTRNSKHIPQEDGYGHAVDLGVFVDGKYIPGNTPAELALYDKLSVFMFKAAEEVGVKIKWGVIIRNLRTDKGHYEYVEQVG